MISRRRSEYHRARRRRHRRGYGADDGTMTLEMALLTLIFVGFMMMLAGLGRIVDVQSQIDGAARDAARAASVARNKDEVAGMAEQAAVASLGGTSWCTNGPQVQADTHAWGPGGQVTVTVGCNVGLGDVAWIGFPGTKTMAGKSTAPIDKYTSRGLPGGAR
ncbi:MAG: TadE family protein [Streptosporangiaceae bacterium]|jgi:Flp pilus assembly protein TadG|nr:TadE family protein [Streptosporangiaceae bacterium]